MLLELTISMAVWLGLGGWAFQNGFESVNEQGRGGLLLACLLLGPFMAGISVADRRAKLKAAKDEK